MGERVNIFRSSKIYGLSFYTTVICYVLGSVFCIYILSSKLVFDFNIGQTSSVFRFFINHIVAVLLPIFLGASVFGFVLLPIISFIKGFAFSYSVAFMRCFDSAAFSEHGFWVSVVLFLVNFSFLIYSSLAAVHSYNLLCSLVFKNKLSLCESSSGFFKGSVWFFVFSILLIFFKYRLFAL